MTTFTLRKGSPAKTRSDAVVVGVCTSGGEPVAAPGAEAVVSAYGKKFADLVRSVGFEGKTGQVAKVPSGDTLKSPLLVLVGLGAADELTANGVRRGAGIAGRAVSKADHVVLALPARDASEVRAVFDNAATLTPMLTLMVRAVYDVTVSGITALSQVAGAAVAAGLWHLGCACRMRGKRCRSISSPSTQPRCRRPRRRTRRRCCA